MGSPDINTAILQACCQVFPPAAKAPVQHNANVQHLWQLRRAARYTAVQARRTGRLFAAWRATIRYHLAAKAAKKQCYADKRKGILNLLDQAEQAATQGDQRQVYQVVKRLAPWAPRRQNTCYAQGRGW